MEIFASLNSLQPLSETSPSILEDSQSTASPSESQASLTPSFPNDVV